MKPNVLLIIVDALRADHLEISGYPRPVSPNLSRLAESNQYAKNYFTNGSVTQVAFPSIFTSTLPLDFGGYNDGVWGRPDTVSEIFQTQGYSTASFITGHPCCTYFGYGRGFDYAEDLIDLNQWFRQIFKVELRELATEWEQTRDTDLLGKIVDRYRALLKETLAHVERLDRQNVPFRGRNRHKLRKQIEGELQLLAKQPDETVEKLLTLDQEFQYFLGSSGPSKFELAMQKAQANLYRVANSRITLLSKRRAYLADMVIKRFFGWLDKRDSGRPFFGSLHLFDLHESKFLLSDLTAQRVLDLSKHLPHTYRHRDKATGAFLYDTMLSIVDAKIGDVLERLSQSADLKDTKIIVTGDHGFRTGNLKRSRVKSSDMSRMFYDEFLRVPCIVKGAGEAKVSQQMSSHLDLGPTLLDLAGLDIPPSFKGRSLLSEDQGPGYVINENTGNGVCDIENKSVFLSVRTNGHKGIYALNDETLKESEFYDLSADPRELTDHAKTNDGFVDQRRRLLAIARDRCLELGRTVDQLDTLVGEPLALT